MKTKIFSLVVALFVFGIAPGSNAQVSLVSKTKVQNPSGPDDVSQKLDSLTLDQKIGQLFVFGINGKMLDKNTLALLQSLRPGGVIIFSRNISSHSQIAQLNYSINRLSMKASGVPALIMVDQEGGSVTRIKTNPSAPSALALGMTRDLPLIEQAGRLSGDMLSLLGFNMNLAPVLDLSSPHKKNFIGNRSFGLDAEQVKVMAQAFVNGQLQAGIMPTAKHFPGHGSVTQDSHKTLPVKLDTFESLNSTDLVPFKHFIHHSNPSAIMIAHVAFPNIDPSGVPAAFSSVLINNLLRDRLGYNGIVITDDIEMAGADSAGDIGERAVKAIEAGCDMIMVAWSVQRQRKALAAVRAAVESGRLSMDRVDDSLRRILRAKAAIPMPATTAPVAAVVEKKMAGLTMSMKSLTHRVSHSNFKKSAGNYQHLRGQLDPKQEVLIFSSDAAFHRSFRGVKTGRVKFFGLSPGKNDPVEKALRTYPQSLPIFYVTGEGTARRLRGFSRETKSRLVVVNATNPGLIGDDSEFRAVFDLHSRDFEAGRWIAEFLFEGGDLRLPSSEPEQASRSHSRRRIPVN